MRPALSIFLSTVLWLTLISHGGTAKSQTPASAVDTIAGPSYCNGPTHKSAAVSIASIAIDKTAGIFADLGPRKGAAGIIRATDGIQTRFLRTGAPLPQQADISKSGSRPPLWGRLAPFKDGGVVVAVGGKLTKMDPSGLTLETIAGDAGSAPGASKSKSSGDGGAALDATFASTRSLAADADYNLFVADRADSHPLAFRIRFINLSPRPVVFYEGTPQRIEVGPGSIDTIAGGDKLPRDGLSLRGIPPVMAAAQGRLYVATTGIGGSKARSSISMINLGGRSLSLHGVSVDSGKMRIVTGPGSPKRAGHRASLNPKFASGLTVDFNANLLIADPENNRVLKLDPAGTLSRFAGGTASNKRSAVGQIIAATEDRLRLPSDVKAGPVGRVYIADSGSGAVKVVDEQGNIAAAPGFSETWKCESVPGSPRKTPEIPLGSPYSVDKAPDGTVYFSTINPRRILRAAGGKVEKGVALPKCLAPECRQEGGARTSRSEPLVVARGEGGLYVLDAVTTRIYFWNTGRSGLTRHGVRIGAGKMRPVAGNGKQGSASEKSQALANPLTTRVSIYTGSVALAADRRGNLFFADNVNARVRMIDRKGTIRTFAGQGGPANRSRCCLAPTGLAVPPSGDLYISSSADATIWFANVGAKPLIVHGQSVGSGEAKPVAGTGKPGVGATGPALQTPLFSPRGLAIDGKGNLYIADFYDHSVRKIDRSGLMTTVAGTGREGFNGDGLRGPAGTLRAPNDVALDLCGNLLIADAGNARIRKLNLQSSCSE